MTKKLGFFGTAAAAFAAMLGMAPAQPTTNPTTPTEQRSNENPKQLPGTEVSRRQQRVQHAGGFDVVTTKGFGMEPQWYGENIVRKGTHKRTNKKRK